MGSCISGLQSASLDELIAAAQLNPHDDSPEMGEIVRRFDRLARKIASRRTTCPMLREDLANAARMALVRAVRRHDGRFGFARYAEKFMRGAAGRELGQWARQSARDLPELDEGHEQRPVTIGGFHVVRLHWGDGELAEAIGRLALQHQVLLHQRYVEDRSLSDMATLASTSESAVSQRLHTIHRLIARAVAA